VTGSSGLLFDSRVVWPVLQGYPRYQESAALGGMLQIPLDGVYVQRTATGTLIVPGGEATLSRVNTWDEQWLGDRVRIVVVEWDVLHGDRLNGSAQLSTVNAQDMARVAQFAEFLQHGASVGRAAAVAVSELVSLVRSWGVPLAAQDPDALEAGRPALGQQIADAISETLCNLQDAPMRVDLERAVGRSERQLRRIMEADAPWFSPYVVEPGWRGALNHHRWISAAALMASKDASIAEIAAATGYQSERALATALKNAGFPAPGAMRSRTLELWKLR